MLVRVSTIPGPPATHDERVEARRRGRRRLRDATILAGTAAAAGVGIFAGLAEVNVAGAQDGGLPSDPAPTVATGSGVAAGNARPVFGQAPADQPAEPPAEQPVQQPAQQPAQPVQPVQQPFAQQPYGRQPVAVSGASRHR